ncbi:MAG: DAK2 domain-containing protein [Candidatus Dormibacteria bacterium]|jgi:DAK2 domain fusion protein YloV
MTGAEGAEAASSGEPLREIDGETLLAGLRSSLAWLQANQEQVNELNVFPVPDGDTGSNMYLTMRSAVEDAQAAPVLASAASVMRAAAHGSLMGARGNSGVILSQIFRGFAQGVGDRERLDAQAVAGCLGESARVAYKAVMKPTEGTILTVIREAADAAQRAAAGSFDIRVVLDDTVREAHAAVERTIDQLAVLREAGVVDAGGFGLAVILEGLTRSVEERDGTALRPRLVGERRSGEPRVRRPDEPSVVPDQQGAPSRGQALAAPPSSTARRRGAASVAQRDEGWGYCTEFMISGPGLDVDAIRAELGGLGESSLVVGDADLVRVHIHTADPAALIGIAAQRGGLSNLKVEDMTAQHHEILERAARSEAGAPPSVEAEIALPGDGRMPAPGFTATVGPQAATSSRRFAVVAVAPGDGFQEIFRSLGADAVVEGGQTMNPSTKDLLAAVRGTGAASVVILPNNGNVIMTAEQVQQLAEGIDVRVAPSRNVPQGISAMLAIDPNVDGTVNARRMTEAMPRVSAVEVTRAVRKSTANGLHIAAGDVIALVDDEIVQVGDDEAAVIEAVLRNQETPPELVTVYWGSQVDEPTAATVVERLRGGFPGTEFELHRGGQDHYPYVLSLE